MTADSLNVTAGANISQTGALAITNAAIFNAPGFDISLDNALFAADFGSLTLTGAAVSVSESSATNIAGVTADSLTLISTSDITQSGDIAVSGAASLATSATSDITIDTGTVNFDTLNVTGRNITVAEDSDTILAGANAISLDLTSIGTITDNDAGSLTVTNATFSGVGAITLDNTANKNDFGTVAITSVGNAVTLVDLDDIDFGSMTADSLSVTAGADITQTGILNIANAAVFDATGFNISLDHVFLTADFGSVNLTGTSVSVRESSATNLAGVTASSLTLTSASHITQSGDISVTGDASLATNASSDITINTGSVNFDTLDVAGRTVTIAEDSNTVLAGANAATLDITSVGTITDNDAESLIATNAILSGVGEITLDNTANKNDFGAVSIASNGNPVVLVDANDIELGTMDSSSLSVTSSGSTTESGGATISVSGQTLLNTGNASTITLSEANNNFNSFAVSSTNDTITVVDDDGITLGSISTQNLAVTTGGAIIQSDALLVSSSAVFDAGGITPLVNDIVLADPGNDFSNVTITQAGEVTITDTSGLSLQGAITGDNLNVTVDADNNGSDTLSVTGTLNVGGDTILSGSTSANETIDVDADILSTGALTIQNANLVDLASSVDLTGSSVSVDSKIGSISLSGNTSNVITSTGGTIDLDTITSASSLLSLDSGNSTTSIAGYTGVGILTGDLQVVNSDGITFTGAVDAGTVTLANTSIGKTIAFQGDTSIAALTTANRGYIVSFTGSDNSISTGVNFINTGGLVLGDSSTDTILFDSGATANVLATTIAGNVYSSRDIFTFSDITLTADAKIDTTNNGVSATGAAINITGNINGQGHVLTLNSGSAGTLTISGSTDAVSALTIDNSAGSTFQGTVGASSPGSIAITDTSSGQNISFLDDTHITTLTTAAKGYGVSFTGDSNQIDNNAVFANTGDVILGDSDLDSILFSGGASSTASNLNSIAGTVQSGGDLSIGATRLTANSQINTSGNNLNLGSINGSGNSLDLNAGATGSITVSGAVDNITGSTGINGEPGLVITNSFATTFQNSVGTLNAGKVTLLDTADNQKISFQGNTHITTLETRPEGYTVEFTGNDNTVDNNLSFSNTGDVILGDESSDSIEFVSGLSVLSPNQTIANGTISTINSDLTLGKVSIVNNGDLTLSTSGGSGNLLVTDTIQGDGGAGDESLTINTGIGDLTLANVLGTSGGADPLGLTTISITNSNVNSFATIDIAGILTQTNPATGSTTFTQHVALSDANLAGTTFSVQNGIAATGEVSVNNSGIFTLANGVGGGIDTTNGFSATGDVNASNDITAVAGDISINGDLTIGQAQDLLFQTVTGSISIAGTTLGTEFGLNEKLSLDSGTGTIQLGDVLGTAGGADAAGLTDLTIVNSAAIDFSAVDIEGQLNQTNAATGATTFNGTISLDSSNLSGTSYTFADVNANSTLTINASGNTAFNGIVAVDAAVLTGANFTLSDFTTINDLTVTSVGGRVTQNLGSLVTVGGNSSFTADILDLGNVSQAATGIVTLNIANDATLINNVDLSLQGSVGGDLVAEARQSNNGKITDNGLLAIGGTSTLTAESIDLGSLQATGAISLNVSDDATITNSVATIIEGNVTNNLTLEASTGSITDTGPVAVGDLAIFVSNGAGDNITLDNVDNSFGRLSLTSTGSVKVREVDSTLIESLTADSFDLNSGGEITDGTDSTLSVTTVTKLASPENITLGNDAGDLVQLGSLDLDGDDVSIIDKNPAGITLADADISSLSLVSQGPISSLDNSIIRVTNQALLNAASGTADIDLASATNATNTFGRLSLTGATVQVREQDDTALDQVTADSFSLISGGEVSDNGVLTISGLTLIEADGRDIRLDSSTNAFGELNINGGDVEIREGDASHLVQLIADNFTLTSGGEVTEAVNAPLTVDGLFEVDSVNQPITLPGTANVFGSVSLTGSDITINEANATRLDKVDADTLNLTSAGNLTQLTEAVIDVIGSATFDVGGNNITLEGPTNTFGSLEITGSSVKIAEADNTTLDQVTVDKLTIISTGSISATSELTVSNLASFTAGDGDNDITLDDPQNAFGSISAIGNSVVIEEVDDTLLVEVSALDLDLNSAGNITDSIGADVSVSGSATIVSDGDITLGDDNDDSIQLGVTNLTGNTVSLTESNSTNLENVTANSLTVTSTAGDITQTGTSTINVSDDSTLNATNITLEGPTNTFGNLDLTGNTIVIIESQETVLEQVDASQLTLESGGTISDNGSITVTELLKLTTDSDIILDSSENNFGSLDLEGGNITVTENNSSTLDNISAASLIITSGGSIDDGLNANIDVSGNATLTASGDITLGDDTDDTIRFGDLNLSGNAVIIEESDGTLFSGVDVTSLDIVSNGDVLQQDDSVLNVTDLARLNAQDGGRDIILNNGVNTFGSVELTGAIISLLELDDTAIAGIDANELDLDSGGSITQNNGAAIRVTGDANFTAEGDIELDEDNQFGSLGLSADSIIIASSDDIVLSSITAIERLQVFAEGNISQSPGSELQVFNQALFSAGLGSGNITLDQTNSFGSVTLIGNTVELLEIDATQLDRVVAGTLTLTTPGDLTDGTDSIISVQGNAAFNAQDITLGNDLGDSVELGNIDLNARDVILTEFDSTLLGIIDVQSLNVTSLQEIEQTSNSLINVTGTAVFNADNGDKVLSLTENNNNFGSLSLTGSTVTINEQDDTNILNANTASLSLTSDGDIIGEGTILVADSLSASADNGSGVITFEDTLNEFGRLDLEGSVITVNESGNSQIDNVSASESFSLQSTGRISDGTGEILVEGNARFIAEDNVTLGENGILTVGSLDLRGLDVEISESDDTLLLSLEAESLDISSGGDISSQADATIDVLGSARMTADDGAGSIDLSNSVNTFGSLNLAGISIAVSEADDTLLEFVQSDSLSIVSAGGITDASGSTIEIARDASLAASGDIQLGDELDDLVRFGNIDLGGANVSITEADSTLLSGLQVTGDLELISAESISSLPGANLNVSGSTLLNANDGLDDITLDESLNDLGTLDLTGSNISVIEQNTLTVKQIRSNATTELSAPNVILENGGSVDFGNLSVFATESIVVGGDITPHATDNLATIPGGAITLAAPSLTIGNDTGNVDLGTAGGSITITGLSDTGSLTSAALGHLELLGTVNLGSTYNEMNDGAQINLLNDGVGIGDTNASTSATNGVTLTINAGSADVNLGNVGKDAPLTSFTVISGNNLTLSDLMVAGNTVSIDISGDITVLGTISDIDGAITINTGGDQSFGGAISANQGSVNLKSLEGSITTQEAIIAGDTVNVTASDTLTLAGNSTADAVVAGNDVILSAANNILISNDITAGGEVAVFSFLGEVAQAKDTMITSGEQLVLSAETGITVSQLESASNVTLVITATATDITDPVSFARANDSVSPAEGDASPDIRSGGTIVFLAPVADVGGKENDQNFVQRATDGIFYGLDAGKFFSDDIGTSAILNTIPAQTQTNLNETTEMVLNTSSDVLTEIDADFTVASSLARFDTTLSSSRTAEANAGDTSFKASSKSTAASQRDEDEEVAEVDETAFQNLTNYAENPQGILLPQDQQFAYDDEGNIYYLVKYREDSQTEQQEDDQQWELYKVNFTPASEDEEEEKDEKSGMKSQDQTESLQNSGPVFIRLTMTDHGSGSNSGED
jgi:hypothetical protein